MNATITTDTLPTTAQVWQALQVLFGTKLEAASLTVLTRCPPTSNLLFSAYTFPQDEQK